MGNNKPSIPKGSRDFGPEQVLKRNYIIDIIRDTFERYGYQPIETPAMESLSTLSGKYGDEGDKLLFRVLNSGDFLEKANSTEGIPSDYKTLTPLITGKGLRYDLTVPFARYVVMHQSEITFPFKRYQIQPVWRADRPQKGRYREFYQCDVDVIGSDSLLNELELLMITDEIFTSLKINVEIKINNRKVLQGLAEKIGHSDKFTDISTALDKFDKIGLQGVLQELDLLDIKPEGIQEYLEIEGANDSVINSLEKLIGETASGAIGIRELKKLVDSLGKVTVNCPITVDLKLARGLGYYTGTIMEVVALDTEMSSIAGGGRYDDLTGIFGLKDVSGVGISFGLDRIYDVLEGLELFPEAAGRSTQVLFVNFDEKAAEFLLPVVQECRNAGIYTELFPSSTKLEKQMKYANAHKIPYVVLAGSEELEKGVFTLKNMESGEQEEVDKETLINKLSK